MLTFSRRAGVMAHSDAFFSPRFPLLYFAALIAQPLPPIIESRHVLSYMKTPFVHRFYAVFTHDPI